MPSWQAPRDQVQALAQRNKWEKPRVINTDKAPTYAIAIEELKAEGKLPPDTEHRQVKYLNNVIEADHGKLKRLIKPTLGFKSMKTAYATIKGFEAMRALKKGQGRAFQFQPGIKGEVRLIERCFNLGDCAIAEVMKIASQCLENRAS